MYPQNTLPKRDICWKTRLH